MRKIIKRLFMYFVLSVLLKIILSFFIPAPSAFSDEYFNAKLARSFFYNLEFTIHNKLSYQTLPLYPILISIAYIFKNMEVVYFIIKIINSLFSSLILIPSWLLAREFLSDKEALNISVLIAILPSNFAFAPFIMAENLFYPLILFSIYLLYKSLNGSYKYDILTGIFIGLSYLTKVTGLVLLPVVAIILLIKVLKKEYKFFKKGILIFISFSIVIFPWMLRNKITLGFKLLNLLGYYSREINPLTTSAYSLGSLLVRFLYHSGLLILATGVIFFLLSLTNIKDKRFKEITLITFLSSFFFILAASHHCNHCMSGLTSQFSWLTSRPFERYFAPVFPLFFIIGYAKFKEKISKKLVVICSSVLAFSSIITLFPLFPINNISLTWLGIIKYGLDYIIYHKVIFEFLTPLSLIIMALLLGLLPLFSKYHNKIDKNKLLTLFGIFFLLVSMSSYAVNYYNSSVFWYGGEQMQLGLWFNNYDSGKTILFDERDCGVKLTKIDQQDICTPYFTIMGFWLNDNILLGNITPENITRENIDYIITKHSLNLKLVKESSTGIKIYSTN